MAIVSDQSTPDITPAENNVTSELNTEFSGLDPELDFGTPPPTEGWIYPRGVPHTDEA